MTNRRAAGVAGHRRGAVSLVGAVLFASVVALIAPGFPPAYAQAPTRALPATPRLSRRTLSEALRLLQDRGWPIVFSSRLVRASMWVLEEPSGATSRELLTDLLRPHGLAVREGARGRLVVVEASAQPAPPPAPLRAAEPEQPVEGAAVLREEIVVVPGDAPRRGEPAVTSPLGLEETRSVPRLGDDPFRQIGVLPGVGSGATSSRLNVRGGRDDEVLVLLDGLELVSPYHLGDFDAALSFLAPSTVERAELFTGGFPAQYGDRMGGVVDLETRNPRADQHFSLGLDLVHVESSASGALGGDRGRWLLTARGGTYQWPLERRGRDEHPRYWDAFGKLDVDLGPRQSLLIDALVAQDEFELSASDGGGTEAYRSGWDNRYGWIRHTAVFTDDLYADTVIGVGRVGRRRDGSSADPLARFEARERRDLDQATLKQDWQWEAGPLASVKWGFDRRRSEATLDFWSARELSGPLAQLRSEPPIGAGGILERFDAGTFAAYASTQLRPRPVLSFELGLRHDAIELTGESHLSPRLAAAWEIGPRSVLRGAWGWFYQSQRPYELEIEDRQIGASIPLTSERAEHRVLGFEHRLRNGWALELDAYSRRVDDPRARFENLFDPVLVFPELGEDRVRIAPESGTARGLELTVRSPRRGRLAWWATYTASSVTDELGERRVPRANDQPHSFRLNLDYRLGRSFTLDAIWHYHTGWPTTALSGRLVPGADGTDRWVPVLGPLNADRLPDFHRLDLRLGRSWALGRGRLSAHLDLFDLYDRRNVRGFEDIRFELDPQGGASVQARPVTWGGFLPSFGVRWEF